MCKCKRIKWTEKIKLPENENRQLNRRACEKEGEVNNRQATMASEHSSFWEHVYFLIIRKIISRRSKDPRIRVRSVWMWECAYNPCEDPHLDCSRQWLNRTTPTPSNIMHTSTKWMHEHQFWGCWHKYHKSKAHFLSSSLMTFKGTSIEGETA